MTAPIDSTDRSFLSDVPDTGVTVVDFWAAWCGPCRQFAPIFTRSAADNADVTHLKVNVDDNPALADYFSIRSIPTTVFIRDGITVGQFSGAMSSARLNELLDQARSLDMDAVRAEADKQRND